MQAIELETTISPEGGIVLPADYQAIYGRHARLILLLDDNPPSASSPPADRAQRQAALRQALLAVVQAGTFADIDDASAWQREVRVDRVLLGRDDSIPGPSVDPLDSIAP